MQIALASLSLSLLQLEVHLLFACWQFGTEGQSKQFDDKGHGRFSIETWSRRTSRRAPYRLISPSQLVLITSPEVLSQLNGWHLGGRTAEKRTRGTVKPNNPKRFPSKW